MEGAAIYTYPDVTVACEPRKYRRLREGMALTNPRVLGEVLSKATRDYDLGEKLVFYQSIPSVTDLLHVDPMRLEVMHWSRPAGEWVALVHRAGEVALGSLGISLPVEALFRDLAPADDLLD